MHPTPVLSAAQVEVNNSQPAPSMKPAPQAEMQASSSQATGIASLSAAADGEEQCLLVLSGLIGSGKSTFARALVHHFPNWHRCNQDELGDRHAVVYAARTALSAGLNVVIDRTNIDAKQRRTWLELAQDISNPPLASIQDVKPNVNEERKRMKVITVSLTLTIPIELAEERLRVRVGHETIKTPEQALGILPHFLRTYQKASTEEGFHYVLTFPAGKMAREPNKEAIEEILFNRLVEVERAAGVLPDRLPPRSGGAGRGRGGIRGRGEWRGRGRGRGASAVYTPHHQHPPYPQRRLSQEQASSIPLGRLDGEQRAPPPFAAAAASLLPPPAQPETQSQIQ
ncbi:uncharacterized protein MEPE_02371 [Melanopsichium pennsylvanicum]|uniref:tRNA ligase kinase domain-containing protein n=2 Tax=Melanopsichium pennsylvanicum TaxID=63383 RepID=A0AAJ4XJ94_9BASI|nr:uncharacterized protein MEPE_02371 [Melanopsichium pennsylvanicum]